MDNEKRDWAQLGIVVLLLVSVLSLGFMWTREGKPTSEMGHQFILATSTRQLPSGIDASDFIATSSEKSVMTASISHETPITENDRFGVDQKFACKDVADFDFREISKNGNLTVMTPEAILELTNFYRASCGLPHLKLNDQLTKAAELKLADMIAQGYWNHTSPDGKSHNTFIDQVGYKGNPVGENLAQGFSNAGNTVVAWIGSKLHRYNLLGIDRYGYKTDFNEIGIAISTKGIPALGYKNVVLQLFGKR